MTNFAGATITFDVEDTVSGRAVQVSIEGYGNLISAGLDIPRTSDRDIVVMTDRAAYEQLTRNDTTGLTGQISTRVPGQYTIFVDPGAQQAPQVGVHETMHITHPELGSN